MSALRRLFQTEFWGSMRLRIPLGIMLIIGLITLIFGNIAIQKQRKLMLDQIDSYGHETSAFIAQISIVPLQKYSFYQLENYITHVERGELVAFCVIYDEAGHPLAGSTELSNQFRNHANVVIFSSSITADNIELGKVELGVNLAPMTKRIDATSFSIVIGLAIELLLIGFALSYFIHTRLVSPVVRLSQTTRNIANGIFSLSDQEHRRDEVGGLARSINEMSTNLRESYHTLETKVAERTAELFEAKNSAENMARNLERLSAEQQTLLDNSPVGIAFVSNSRVIMRVNLEFSRITGYEPEELIGKSSQILYKSPEIYEQYAKIMHNLEKLQGIRNVTIELQHKNGSLITCALRGRATLFDNGESGIIWSIEDITAKLKMEEELLKIKKLESIGVLAGGIAHDFNNILVAVIGNISLAEQFTKDNPKAAELLTSARNASLRAKDLTAKLLTFARGGDPIHAVEHLPDQIKQSASFILSGSNVTCSYDFADNLWPVHMDKGQINQVIQNLVLNSSQAMQGGGSITICCRNRSLLENELHGLQEGNYVNLTITDCGHGIAEDHLTKVFDPYFSTKEKDSNKGSGLGLAIVHSIIKKHNGSITVSSKQREGTTFEIFLPATADSSGEYVPESDILPTGKGTILVMDDDQTIHAIIEEMLKYLGYSTIHAKDGKEAIELYKQDFADKQRITAVVLDLTIPGGMGGAQAVKELLEINPHVKAIVSSGYSDTPLLQNYREAGFTNIISKPYQLLDLSKVIAETVKH